VANLATEIGADVQGLTLTHEDGTLREELYEIFDLIKEADAILATGHVTKEEAKVAVREAAKRGVKKIVVTHPAATFVHYSVADMKEILDLGATYSSTLGMTSPGRCRTRCRSPHCSMSSRRLAPLGASCPRMRVSG